MPITYSKPRKNQFGEWEAKAWKDGKRHPDADIFESTKEDALADIENENKRVRCPAGTRREGNACVPAEGGYGVSGLMRDYLVNAGVEYQEAEKQSQEFDRQIKEADWLHTYDGTTFTKSFKP